MDNQKNNPKNIITRRLGDEARISNFEAVKSIANVVKTTLGPKGMDKMLINEFGDIVITNDGYKILTEMKIEHPAAKMVVEVAKTQENEVGDGTTSSVILTGELINKASELINKKIHPTIIIDGYNKALEKSLELLNELATKIEKKDFIKVIKCSMLGKITEKESKHLSYILNKISENNIKTNNLKILKIPTGSINETELIEGLVINKEVASLNMPKKIKNANVLLINSSLDVKELNFDMKYNISTPEQYENLLKKEEESLKGLFLKIKNSGVNVIFCQKGINEKILYHLEKSNITAFKRVKKTDLELLSNLLNINILNSVDDIDERSIGYANLIEEKEINNDKYIFIYKENPKAVAILLKSSTKHILDEVERAITDALGNLITIRKNPYILAGGGAIEFELHKRIMDFSKKFKGKEQLAIKAFAESMLIIPKTLSENSGFDSLEMINEGIIKHNNNQFYSGINSYIGFVENVFEYNIIEPLNTKIQALKSAIEVTNMILRIDDIIASAKTEID